MDNSESISIVLPVFNEASNLSALDQGLHAGPVGGGWGPLRNDFRR